MGSTTPTKSRSDVVLCGLATRETSAKLWRWPPANIAKRTGPDPKLSRNMRPATSGYCWRLRTCRDERFRCEPSSRRSSSRPRAARPGAWGRGRARARCHELRGFSEELQPRHVRRSHNCGYNCDRGHCDRGHCDRGHCDRSLDCGHNCDRGLGGGYECECDCGCQHRAGGVAVHRATRWWRPVRGCVGRWTTGRILVLGAHLKHLQP